MRTKTFITAGIFAVIAAVAAIAGSLDAPGGPGTSAGSMSTLTEIYNCLDTGTCVDKTLRTGFNPENPVNPVSDISIFYLSAWQHNQL